jgi:hypothetical protein
MIRYSAFAIALGARRRGLDRTDSQLERQPFLDHEHDRHIHSSPREYAVIASSLQAKLCLRSGSELSSIWFRKDEASNKRAKRILFFL